MFGNLLLGVAVRILGVKGLQGRVASFMHIVFHDENKALGLYFHRKYDYDKAVSFEESVVSRTRRSNPRYVFLSEGLRPAALRNHRIEAESRKGQALRRLSWA